MERSVWNKGDKTKPEKQRKAKIKTKHEQNRKTKQQKRSAQLKDDFEKSNKKYLDFPGGAVVKNPPANAGDMGSSPGPGRSHMPQSN